ncbi:MAG: DUF523 domain-containing protein [Desulfofustis sp.]|nr:DUF523 domain-containing protein [Desulfofustis sp.]
MTERRVILVSACLAGLRTRYDSKIVNHHRCRKALEGCTWIPVCPEQLGGLPTPRCPADIFGGDGSDVLEGRARVVGGDGRDLTEHFIRGAEMVLEIAGRLQIEKVYLKARSPSCGVTKTGVTAALLQKHGFELEEFE